MSSVKNDVSVTATQVATSDMAATNLVNSVMLKNAEAILSNPFWTVTEDVFCESHGVERFYYIQDYDTYFFRQLNTCTDTYCLCHNLYESYVESQYE